MYIAIHTAKSELLLFGGVSMPYNEFINDCWVLRADPKSSSGLICSQLTVKGTPPDGLCTG
jgi:hypothetical protein